MKCKLIKSVKNYHRLLEKDDVKQMLEKLHRDRQHAIYFGKVDVEGALKQAEEDLKKLGVLQRPSRPLFDR